MKRNENASPLKRPSDRNPPRRGGPRPPPPPPPLPPPPPPLPLAFEEAFSSKGFPPKLVLASSNKVSLWCVDDDAFFLSFFFSFVFFSLFFFETEKFFEKKKIVSFRSSQKNDFEEKTKTRDVFWAGSLMSRGGGAETGGLLLSGGPFRSAFEFGCATPNERHPLFLLRVSLLSFLFRFREVRSFLSRARVFFCSSVSSFFGGFY